MSRITPQQEWQGDDGSAALYTWQGNPMQRWATFFLLLLCLLAQARPLAANALFGLTRPVPPPTTGAALPSGDTRQDCITRTPFASQDCMANSNFVFLQKLVQAADGIVRGRVTTIHSFWNPDHSLIESAVTIAVAYTMIGPPQRTITIHTAGGFLAAEGIGMVSMHEANWAVGEEILAFVYHQGEEWRTVGGATGKFLIEQSMVLNQDLALAQPLAGVLPTVVTLVKQRGQQAQIATPWRQLAAVTADTLPAPVAIVATPTDTRKWATPNATAPFTINLNSAQIGGENGSRAHFRQAIIAAATSWSQVPNADFALTYAGENQATQTGYNGVNEVLFMHKGTQERAAAAQVWFTTEGTIIEADIWINDDYRWNATGALGSDEVDLQSALLHEFGHWLILAHCADSQAVMFAKLTTGTLKRELQPSDILGIRTIYPE